MPFYYEVWQTNDGNSPVYFRFVFSSDSVNRPVITYAISHSLTSSNFPNGNYTKFGVSPDTELRVNNTSGTARAGSQFECNIAGNGSTNGDCWLAICMWRNITEVGSILVLTFDRTRTASGGQVDTYSFINHATGVASSPFCVCLFKPGAGTSTPVAATNLWTIGFRTGTMLFNGMTPVSPIFPAAGFVGNPTLALVAFCKTDVPVDGLQAMCSIASEGTHNYLVIRNVDTLSAVSSGIQCAGIRWD
jgi:hypothetical protein